MAAATSTTATIPITLLISTTLNRVVFAESDSRFVDVLLSFLTLPTATILSLLSFFPGSLPRLFASVESLDPDFLAAPACKSMLLRPRSAAGPRCESLPVSVDDYARHRVYFKCSASCGLSAASAVEQARCPCGGPLEVPICRVGEKGSGDGVFVEGKGRFLVGDDLLLVPVSMGEGLEMMRRLGVEDGSEIETRSVDVGSEEILLLLKRSFVSETPLTDVFLQEPNTIDFEEKLLMRSIAPARVKHDRTTTNPKKKINVKLYLSSETNQVVYAESGKEFVDLLFSFLTFPLGAILKLLGTHSAIRCVDNLYKSVGLLSMKSEESKDMLLSPKLAPHFGCSSQLLDIGEAIRQNIRTSACKTCEAPVSADRCFHGMHYGVYDEIDPRRQNLDSVDEEGYAKGSVKFMVTDELEVTPLSPISGVHIIKKMMLPVNCLEEAEASLGEAEALDLLQACLVSRTPLSDVFSSCLLTLYQEKWFGKLPNASDKNASPCLLTLYQEKWFGKLPNTSDKNVDIYVQCKA